MTYVNILEYEKAIGNCFRFLDLPREIRDMIYHLALVSPTGGRLNLATAARCDTDKWSVNEGFAPNINLLCSCKQIQAEALSIFYRNNTFIMRSCTSPCSTDYFPSIYLELLRSVELRYTILHCPVSVYGVSGHDVRAESLSIDKAFRMQFEHHKGLVDYWSAKSLLITKLPSLRDLTVNVADQYLQKYARTAQLWIISVTRALIKKRHEEGLAACQLHVTGLLLQNIEWFMGASTMNNGPKKRHVKRKEINVFS